jgi:hypothetical protein
MKSLWICGVASVAMLSLAALAEPAWGGSTKCKMKYSLAGWSAGYSTATGSGTITCDNGQSARVSLRAKGGGVTAGKSKTINGSGTFSEVDDIGEVFGSYASADVHAGAGSSAAQVATKGTPPGLAPRRRPHGLSWVERLAWPDAFPNSVILFRA